MPHVEPEPGVASEIQRGVLPIPECPYAGPVKFDAKDPASKFPPIEPLRPPEGAPMRRTRSGTGTSTRCGSRMRRACALSTKTQKVRSQR